MLLKKSLLAVTVASTLLLGACKEEAASPGLYEVTGDVVATVNGVSIRQPQVDEYTAYRAQMQQPSANPVEELVNLEILRQAAVKAGKHMDDATRAAMTRAATDALANALVQEQITAEISDEDLKAEYDIQIAQMQAASAGGAEFNSSHILVETEEEALAIIASITEGADFAETAKEKSTGPSGPNGGELGWASPATFVPEFSAAMAELEVGAVTAAPVKTQFGYHVIKLNDKREAQAPEAPAFEQVKPQVRNAMLQKRMKEYMDGLRDSAKVVVTELEAEVVEAAPVVEAPVEAPAEVEADTEEAS
jgi:peptidyl-prolyl cis-trans isomerase C